MLFWSAGFTAGKRSTIDDIIREAGAVNVAAEKNLTGSAAICPEQVIAADPEYILLCRWSGDEREGRIENHPLLRNLQAVQEKRVLAVEGRYLTSVSQFVVDGAERLAAQLHPERFPNASPPGRIPGVAMNPALTVTATLTALYLGLAVVGTAWGTFPIPPGHVLQTIGAAVGLGTAEGVPANEQFVVLHLRLPQVLLLGLVGAALACSGAALQATFENPLADPGVLGVSGGAALGAVIAIHTGLAAAVFLALPVCAFGGGLVAALLVYSLTYLAGRRTVHSLLLTGVAVGSMAVAGITLVMVITEQHRVQELLFWMVGGVRNQTWEHVWISLPAIAVGLLGLLLLHRPLDALLLGEEQALAVGVSVVRTRLLVLACTALATGAATAVSGTIGFVGLMVPHVVRRLTGPRTVHLLPGCIAGGAAFLTACELISRCLADRFVLHLGILTAFLGGPAFLLVLRQTERRPE